MLHNAFQNEKYVTGFQAVQVWKKIINGVLMTFCFRGCQGCHSNHSERKL